MPRKRKGSPVLDWVKGSEPNSFGRRCALRDHAEARQAVEEVCAMRRAGKPTPSMRDLADKLLDVYPELADRGPFGFIQLRDYIARHIKGGWGGRL